MQRLISNFLILNTSNGIVKIPIIINSRPLIIFKNFYETLLLFKKNIVNQIVSVNQNCLEYFSQKQYLSIIDETPKKNKFKQMEEEKMNQTCNLSLQQNLKNSYLIDKAVKDESDMGQRTTMKPLVIRTHIGETFFDYQDIIRLEADGCRTNIYHIKGEILKSSINISNLEKALPENIFFRTHRSHIINLKFVSNFNAKTSKLTVAGVDIPISETYQQNFMKLISSDNSIRYIR